LPLPAPASDVLPRAAPARAGAGAKTKGRFKAGWFCSVCRMRPLGCWVSARMERGV